MKFSRAPWKKWAVVVSTIAIKRSKESRHLRLELMKNNRTSLNSTLGRVGSGEGSVRLIILCSRPHPPRKISRLGFS